MQRALLVIALLLTATATQAQSLCPRGYFQASARNAFYDSRVSSTLCIALSTTQNRINMRAMAIAELPVTTEIETIIMRRLSGMQNCSADNLNGWRVDDLDAKLVGASPSPRLRIVMIGRLCYPYVTTGLRATYEVPLVVSSQAASRVVVRADTSRSTIVFPPLQRVREALLSQRVKDGLDDAVSRRLNGEWDYATIFPGYAQLRKYVLLTEMRVEKVDATLRAGRLKVQASAGGYLTQAAASRLLQSAIATEGVPYLQRWLGVPSL